MSNDKSGQNLVFRVKDLVKNGFFTQALNLVSSAPPSNGKSNGKRRESLRLIIEKLKDHADGEEKDQLLGLFVSVCFSIGDIEIARSAITLIRDAKLSDTLGHHVGAVIAGRLLKSEGE